MQTTDLIDNLTANLRPIPPLASLRRLAVGLAIGAAIALAAVWMSLGLRSDFASVVLTSAFWMKWGLGLGVGAAALALCMRLGRPEGAPGTLPAVLVVPVVLLAGVALLEIVKAPAGERVAMWLGGSALQCPWIIAALAIPVFVGVLWALRHLAPTRHRLAGFSAGCLAGGVAALVYAIHCDESAAAFVVTWYTAGILLPALLGALIGPRVLRW